MHLKLADPTILPRKHKVAAVEILAIEGEVAPATFPAMARKD